MKKVLLNIQWTGNLIRQLSAMFLSKTADQLTNPKTVLTWLMGAMGAPVVFIGWLVPIRESLSMLPQFLLAGWIRTKAYRKPVWVLGASVQGGAILLMILTGYKLTGWAGGLMILGALVLFSLGRALCSITGKDVLGKTIPKSQRGKVNGLATSGAGGITLLFGLLGLAFLRNSESSEALLIPLMIAFICWIFAIYSFAGIKETSGETEAFRHGGLQLGYAWELLSSDKIFRDFVIARAFMTGSALMSPYIVLYSQNVSGNRLGHLGGFIFAGAFASMFSGFIWGRMADLSSRRVLVTASILAGAVSFFLLSMRGIELGDVFSTWMFPVCYLLLTIAHDGIRVGRKTYLINLGSGNKRTDYVSISNSLIGCFLILMGGLVSILQTLPTAWIVLIFGLMSLFGGGWSLLMLPHLEKE